MIFFNDKPDVRKPKGWEVLLLFFMSVLLATTIAPIAVKHADILWSIAAVNTAVFLLIPLLFVSYSGYDFRETFRLKRPRAVHVVLTTLLVVSAYFLMNFLAVMKSAGGLLTPDETVAIGKKMELAQMITGRGAAFAVFFLAFMPSIVEEFFFRGVILSGLENAFAGAAAIILAGLMFGIVHYGEGDIMILLGIVLAYVAVKGNSIFLTIYGHFLFNLISVFLLLDARGADVENASGAQLPAAVFVLSLIGLFAGILIFGRTAVAHDNNGVDRLA